MIINIKVKSIVTLMSLILVACAAPVTVPDQSEQPPDNSRDMASESVEQTQIDEHPAKEATRPKPQIATGSGVFINQDAAERRHDTAAKGNVTLNFDNTAIDAVIKLILDDLLGVNYVIEPSVKGSVTLKTSKPVSRDSLLPVLEEVLKLNNAALIWSDGFYRISSLTGAVQATSAIRSRMTSDGAGFAVEIIPLQYISAKEMNKILEPLIPKQNMLLVDETRNLLVVGGTSHDLRGWRDTVDIFDVDWMSGYSIGMFPLQYGEARVVSDELNKIVGEYLSPESSHMIRIEALERLNSILVLSPQEKYLEQLEVWIDRLDRIGDGPTVRLFTYPVKNRKASELAEVLTNVFGSYSSVTPVTAKKSLAPGLKPIMLSTGKKTPEAASGEANVTSLSPAESHGLSLPGGGEVRIVADESNNSILVMASAQDYQVIESALKRLDVIEAQVLIEASIMEVSLSDDLSYGLEWYIKQKNVLNNRSGEALLDLNGSKGLGSVIPGFSYSLIGEAGVDAVLNALASDSKLNVISSPSLMVLDNRTARISVGDQVPVRTETATTEAGVIIESIQFKDTGVQLEVKPRINAGDLITLEIRQDVTDAGAQDSATGQRSFRQRNIESSIAIQSGETIMLGGLITENATEGTSGVPVLSKIPVLGALFGRNIESKRRTELIVMITPRVVRTVDDATHVTDEYRRRMISMKQQGNTPALLMTPGDE